MVVVTCGDCAADQLRAVGLAGEVIVWRDILHEGPVPGGLEPDQLDLVRADYLASLGGPAPDVIVRDLRSRHERLVAATAEPLALWFDDNLVNQLQLCQVLATLATLDPKEVWLAGLRTFGGAPAQLLHRSHDERRLVTQAHIDQAVEAWQAFTADNPQHLAELAGVEPRQAAELDAPAGSSPAATPQAGPQPDPEPLIADLVDELDGRPGLIATAGPPPGPGDASGPPPRSRGADRPLPALNDALHRHLRQYPWTRDGLGETERRGVAAINAGCTGFVDIFLAHAEGDDPPFMGDSTFRHYLERLARGPRPLVHIDGAGHYRITSAGERVLAGRADQIKLNGIDRWYGGVRLRGRTQWRWDGTNLVRWAG
jgi:hypothetical protein